VKRLDRKSDCAINFSLENFGDPWSLLIVRDIVYFGKKTYGEFLASEEHIGTSVLARRLSELERKEIITKKTSLQDRRIEEYSLTEKGLDLIPVLLYLVEWGAKYDKNTGARKEWVGAVSTNKQVIAQSIRSAIKRGGSVLSEYERIVKV
jgi:DNA-binding HxlR family transcriptional regulator